MNFPQLLVIVIVVIPLGLVIANRIRVDVAALVIAVALGIAQLLGLGILGAANTPGDAVKAISGLSQPVVITLFSLFIITQALDKTGVTRAIARRVLAIGGHSETRLIILFTATTALLSLFMNNLAAGALLLPSAMDVARRTGIKPSKLLIPVAYGSLLGGVATYFTTANIIVSDLLTTANPPQAPLHIWDFTPTGGLIALAGIAFIAIFGPRLLPDRPPKAEQAVVRRTGSELEDLYHLNERLWEARLRPDCSLIGKPLGQTGISDALGLSVPAIWHGQTAIFAPAPDQIIQANDILLIVGREERVNQLIEKGVIIGRDESYISPRGVSFFEAVLAPHSRSEGQTLKQIEFRTKYALTAVALLRDERSYRTDVADIQLMAGDSLLLVGAPERIRKLQASPDFIALVPDSSDQPLKVKSAAFAAAVILISILASLVGVPVYLSMLTGAVVVVLSGILTMEEAYRSMEWSAIFLIAGMYTVSVAMVKTGLADLIGQGMLSIVTPMGPLGLAAGAFLLSALLTQIMGGQVTALVSGPIVISAAISLNTNPQAIAVAAAIGCSATFLTPLAHPVNILMIGPANYRFSDFFRLGWGLTILAFLMLMLGMVLFWKL